MDVKKKPLATAIDAVVNVEDDASFRGSTEGILSFKIFGVPALQAVLQLGLGGLAVFWLGQSVGGFDPILQLVAMGGLFAVGSIIGYYSYTSFGVYIEDLINKILPFSFSF